MKKIIDLSEKRILVTGASNGIGAQVCRLISSLGAKVIMVARQEIKMKEIMQHLTGTGHAYYAFDLTEIESIEDLLKKIVKENGKLDGIVHCAGKSFTRPLKQVKFSLLHETMLINFYAFFELVRVYSSKKINNGLGSVVVMSSSAAVRGDKAMSGYAASKAAIEGAIKPLAKELSDKNIRINAVRAGMIRTAMFDSFSEKYDESAIKALLDKQYLGIIETEDVADAIAYLLSDAAKFITGTSLVIDGGFLS